MSKQKNHGYKKTKNKPDRSNKTYGKQTASKKGKSKGNDSPSRGQKSVTAEVTCSGLTNEGRGIAEWKGKQLEVPLLYRARRLRWPFSKKDGL